MKKFFTLLTVTFIVLSACLNIACAKDDGIELPILMYHSVLKSKNGVYIVSPSQLERDFKRLTENGYNAEIGRAHV